MSKYKCCANCIHFKNEDAKEIGLCEERHWITIYSNVCKCHKHYFDGWTEITPDNVESLKQVEEKRIVIASKHNSLTFYRCLHDVNGLDSMVKQGGYYYFILPELNIDETK